MEVPRGLAALPKQLVGILSDLNRIGDGMQQLVVTLEKIEKRVESLDREVTEMHQAVERLDEGVEDVKGSLHPLRRRIRRAPRAPGDG